MIDIRTAVIATQVSSDRPVPPSHVSAPARPHEVSINSLTAWMSTLIGHVRSDRPDLTNRQMALMMIVSVDPAPHTVRGLALRLGVVKPVVSRALDRLAELDYVKRVIDKRDRRNVLVVPTEAGLEFLDSFAMLLKQSLH